MDLPRRLAFVKSGRFLRTLSALVALMILAGLLYNAIAVDRVPPTFSLKVSKTDSNGLALTLASVEVTFSEDVEPKSAQAAFTILPFVPGSFHWNGRTMIYTPSTKLPLGAKFTVREGPGVLDEAGNSQDSGVTYTFTTIGPPTVVSVNPAVNQASVPTSTSIQITFDRQMDISLVAQGLAIDPPVQYSLAWNGPVLTIQPGRPLAYGTTYTVKIGDPAVDTDGTRLSAWVTSFRTVDVGLLVSGMVPAPNVAGVSPRTPIAVVFDGAIDPASIADAIRLTPPVAGTVKAVSLPDDSTLVDPSGATPARSANVLLFTPDAPLASHTTYSVALSATVKQVEGQVAPAQSWSFTTGEVTSNGLNQIAFLSDRAGVSNVWLMNPDGSNQRQVTTELVPVAGFAVSGDGTTIAYSAGGVVKKMAISGEGLTTLTPAGDYEYAPDFTPDGLGLVVGRRDAAGKDLGYWRYPFASGTDLKQLTPDGAPGIGSVTLKGDGLTGSLGLPSWSARAAFTQDEATMLLVRGSDNVVELVDTTAATAPVVLPLIANSAPVFDAVEGAFYVVASDDRGSTWACWRVTKEGVTTRLGTAASDIAMSGGTHESLALIVKTPDGSYHLAFAATPTAAPAVLTNVAAEFEQSPSFAPDSSLIVFGRVYASDPKTSAGIWVVGTGGGEAARLSTDGAYPRWIP